MKENIVMKYISTKKLNDVCEVANSHKSAWELQRKSSQCESRPVLSSQQWHGYRRGESREFPVL